MEVLPHLELTCLKGGAREGLEFPPAQSTAELSRRGPSPLEIEGHLHLPSWRNEQPSMAHRDEAPRADVLQNEGKSPRADMERLPDFIDVVLAFTKMAKEIHDDIEARRRPPDVPRPQAISGFSRRTEWTRSYGYIKKRREKDEYYGVFASATARMSICEKLKLRLAAYGLQLQQYGRYARVTTCREKVWDILRQDDEWARNPFTMREFYRRHKSELDAALLPLGPSSVEGMVRGALQSLAKKGLVQASRSWGDTTYSANVYMVHESLMPLNYGKALVQAQRLRLL
jgi:Fe2+ or Zn2+ uptake regulation protein